MLIGLHDVVRKRVWRASAPVLGDRAAWRVERTCLMREHSLSSPQDKGYQKEFETTATESIRI
jgi:hypothetical protein